MHTCTMPTLYLHCTCTAPTQCLHLSALVCTAAVAVQMVQAGVKMVVPPAFHGIGGAASRLEQLKIRSPYAVSRSAVTVQDGCAQVRVQMVV